MEKRQLNENTWLYSANGSFCESIHHPGGVIVSICRGPQVGGLADFVIAEGEAQLRAHGKCTFFVDALESSMMSSEFREKMTEWFKRNKGRVTVDMLIRSKLLEMALNVANLVIGGASARTYSNVEKWEKVAQQHIPNFRRRAINLPADLR